MSYGQRRPYKDGGFGFGDFFGLGVAGSTGIVAALFADYQQKGEASALYVLNRWVIQATSMLGLPAAPLWMVVLALIVIGGISIFYFQPVTRQGAFTQGFALLATVMTLSPTDLAGGLAPNLYQKLPAVDPALFEQPAEQPGRDAMLGRDNGLLHNAVYTPGAAAYAPAQYVRVAQAAQFNVRLQIDFPNGLKEDLQSMIRKGTVRGRLYNADSGGRFNLFSTAGAQVSMQGNQLIILCGVPAKANTATLWVRVEADGYEIQTTSISAKIDNPVNWQISMAPSDTPLIVQRLNKPYRF